MSAQKKASTNFDAFHPAFVRENTWESWDSSSKQRVEFNLPVEPEIVEKQLVRTPTGEEAWEVRFADGHFGRFDLPRPQQNIWDADLPMVPRKLWGNSRSRALSGAEMNKELGTHGSLRFGYADLCNSADARRRYIEALHVYGLAMVDGMPAEEDTIKEFCNNIQGFASPSCYGYSFTIKAVENPNNLAYSSDGVQMHTDLPFYSVPPSIQLFHCLTQAKQGGGSTWLDGFDCAETLFEQDPAAFKVLCEAPVRFMDVTDDWHVSAVHPIIMLGHGPTSATGMPYIQRVHFNERTRDSWRAWSGATKDADGKFYRALRKFEKIVEDRERYSHSVLLPGEMICTDNFRTLHSRDSFKGARHFKGAYMSWDDLYARWRAITPSAGLANLPYRSKL